MMSFPINYGLMFQSILNQTPDPKLLDIMGRLDWCDGIQEFVKTYVSAAQGVIDHVIVEFAQDPDAVPDSNFLKNDAKELAELGLVQLREVYDNSRESETTRLFWNMHIGQYTKKRRNPGPL